MLSATESSIPGSVQHDISSDIVQYAVNKRTSPPIVVLNANTPYNANKHIQVQVAVGNMVSVNLTLKVFLTHQYERAGVDIDCA